MLRCAITVCSPIISFHLCSLEACFMLTRPQAKTFQSLLCVELVCILVFFMLACLFHLTWLAFRQKQRKIFSTCSFKWQVISCVSVSAQTSQISCEVLVIKQKPFLPSHCLLWCYFLSVTPATPTVTVSVGLTLITPDGPACITSDGQLHLDSLSIHDIKLSGYQTTAGLLLIQQHLIILVA